MITISRQVGSGGDEIARALAEELKWSFLDKESLERVLAERGFPRKEIDAWDEKKPGIWHRLSDERERYLHFLKMAIFEFAREGSCVILGRGSQILLKEIPGTLHVRVVAPLEDRVRSIREKLGCDERRARQYVRHRDNERAGFHRYFFQASCDSVDLYDLVINTRLISETSAAYLIMSAAHAKEVTASRNEQASKLRELYLAQLVVVAILYERNIPVDFLNVEAADGSVTLRGTAHSKESVEQCEEVASGVSGVGRVVNEITLVPEFEEV